MECYVDEMIEKSWFKDHVDDYKEFLETLHCNNMKITWSSARSVFVEEN